MTSQMIVPNSVQDSTAGRHEENSEFQQFEFWVNGVKRTIKIPLQSDVEPNSEGSRKVINVDPGDIDEVRPCSFSADPIVIDPDLNDDNVPLSCEQSVLTNIVALDAVGHCRNYQSNVPQSNASQNDQIGIDPAGSLSQAIGSSRYENRKPVTVRTELEQRRLHHFPRLDVATSVNQSVTSSQLSIRTDLPVRHSYIPNRFLVPSTVSKNVGQPLEKATNSRVPLIPSELVRSSNLNTPLNLSDAGYISLLQTVNSGVPVIMTNSAIRPLGRDGNPVLPSTVSNGSATYVLRPQWQLNTTTSANCSSSTGAMQPGLTKQAASQSSSMLVNKQSHYSVPPQTSHAQLRVADSLANSSGANQSVNLSQLVALNGQYYKPSTSSSSVPIPLDLLSAQVRKVKITTDVNGSCIISVDGLAASSYTDKPTNSNTSNVLTTGNVLRSPVPYGTTFQIMPPNVIQNCHTLRLVSSGTGTLQYMPPNAMGNHRPISLESLNLLPNDKAFCSKQPNCEAYSVPPLSFASPSCTMQTGLAAQGRANGAHLVSGALSAGSVRALSTSSLPVRALSLYRLPSPMCAGSVRASSTSSLPVSALSLYRLPSPMPMNVLGPPQPSVKCSSVACSASFSINSSAVLSKFSSSHPSSIPSGLQSSASLTPAYFPRAIPVTGDHMHRNAASVPSGKSTIDATGSSYNKQNPPLTEFEDRFRVIHVPYQPPVTVYSSMLKSGCSTSSVPEMSQNVVMPPVTRILFNKDQVTKPMAILSPMAIGSKSPSTAVSGAGITTPSASGVKSVSSLLVSSASAWETPTFPQWSRPGVSKSRGSRTPRRASMLPISPVKALASCTWYPPTNYSKTSSARVNKCSVSVMAQNYSTGNTVPLSIPTKVFPALAPTVSCCSNDTSSHVTFSVAQRPIPSLLTPQVTKSAFSFYNSHVKRPGSKSVEKPIPNGQTDIASSIIPISVEFYGSSNVSKKRKHKSSNSMKRNGSCNTSTSSISDHINLLSDPESIISSSESWTSDDSVTMGKRKTRRKLTKRKASKSDNYSTRSLENAEVNHTNFELHCFVSLENLYLNGKTSVDIRDSSENLVCCRYPTRRPMSTVNSLGENVSRKKSYKLSTAVNYLSDTD